MRIALPAITAACALLPVPALAQDLEDDAGRMAEELSDPVRQEQLATAAEAVGEAMLEMPAAPLLRAAAAIAGADPDSVDPDTRVGDLVSPEAADAPRELAHRVPEMMGTMAVLAGSLEAVMPQLREAMDRIEDALPRDY